MNKNKKATENLVLTGLLTAVIIVLTMISIPMPTGVPITLQTFAVALCAYILGSKYGTASVLVYVLLGVVGLPVFSGFQGGFGVLFGFTGGFIWGFFAMVLLAGIKCGTRRLSVCLGLTGLVICHLFGIVQFSFVSSQPFITAFLTVSLPYLIKDVISVLAAYMVAIAVKSALGKLRHSKA